MAVKGEVKARASSSTSVDSQLPDEKPESLSPEDVDWVDSCLVNESEFSEDWFTMKDTFIEALSSDLELYKPYEPRRSENPKYTDLKMIALRDESESDRLVAMEEETEEIARSPSDILFTQEEEEAESSGEKFSDDLESRLAFPFLPSYVKGLKETQTNDLESELNLVVDEIELGTDDIFRVWDLNVPAEENELGKQLKKVMEETDLPLKPSVEAFGGVSGDDLKVESSLEDVINAIANISLGQDSSS